MRSVPQSKIHASHCFRSRVRLKNTYLLFWQKIFKTILSSCNKHVLWDLWFNAWCCVKSFVFPNKFEFFKQFLLLKTRENEWDGFKRSPTIRCLSPGPYNPPETPRLCKPFWRGQQDGSFTITRLQAELECSIPSLSGFSQLKTHKGQTSLKWTRKKVRLFSQMKTHKGQTLLSVEDAQRSDSTFYKLHHGLITV